MILLRLTFVTGLLFIGTCGNTYATTINFFDGNFNSPPWSSITIQGANTGQTSSQLATGGNPDAFLSVTTVTNSVTFTAHMNAGFIYDPSEGAIDTIDISLDYMNISSFGQGHGVSAILVEQDGSFFVAGSFATGSSDFDWQAFSLLGLTSDNFFLREGTGSLDFSTSGSPITFGFETRNSGGNNINVGYDNYNLALNTTPVPLPAALWLFGPAVLGLAGLNRLKKQS